MHFPRMRVAGAVAVTALGLVALGGTTAVADGGPGEGHGGHDGGHGGHDGGEEPLPPLEVSDTEGPPGTVISVTGHECFDGDVELKLKQHYNALDSQHLVPDEGGSWTGELTVPDDETLIGQQLRIRAECNPVYDPVIFTVTEPEPDPEPPTPPAPTPPAPAPGPAPAPAPAPGPVVSPAAGQPSQPATPSAPAATPVAAQPGFAG